ncbi:MAG: zinc ribbon domain-containing protein [Actinobacteria bacterium]|nr:zinc ribbon domain-containing protein [Actinomycetota bacterium]
MPIYEYECNKCENIFEVSMSMKDREDKTIVCPKCKSGNVAQLFYGVKVNINKRSMINNNLGGCCGGTGCS